jgi:hypothetical protein
VCNDGVAAYAVAAPLVSKASLWCVDNSGFAGEVGPDALTAATDFRCTSEPDPAPANESVSTYETQGIDLETEKMSIDREVIPHLLAIEVGGITILEERHERNAEQLIVRSQIDVLAKDRRSLVVFVREMRGHSNLMDVDAESENSDNPEDIEFTLSYTYR